MRLLKFERLKRNTFGINETQSPTVQKMVEVTAWLVMSHNRLSPDEQAVYQRELEKLETPKTQGQHTNLGGDTEHNGKNEIREDSIVKLLKTTPTPQSTVQKHTIKHTSGTQVFLPTNKRSMPFKG